MSRKKLSPTLRRPIDAAAVVLESHDAKAPGRVVHTRKSGVRLLRKTLYMEEGLAVKLGIHAVRHGVSEQLVVGAALRRFFESE